VENVLGATAHELDALWCAAISGMPIINLRGAAISQVDTVNASWELNPAMSHFCCHVPPTT
jgi:hypothetical protein